MELLSFTITLENCDRIEINPRHVLFSSFKDIRPELSSVHNSRHVFEREVCHDAAFLLSKDADVPHQQFGMREWNKESVFRRLASCADITSIEVSYGNLGKDGASDGRRTRELTMAWSDGNDDENRFQRTKTDENGNLTVDINSSRAPKYEEYISDNI